MDLQGNRNETHNRENSENTNHKGHFSVFENYGVSHPDFELHMRIWYVYNKMRYNTFVCTSIGYIHNQGFYGGENAAKSMVYEQHEGMDHTRCEGNMVRSEVLTLCLGMCYVHNHNPHTLLLI